jgi:hypothetical protein
MFRSLLTDTGLVVDRISPTCRWSIKTFSGQGMDKLYLGIGAALYLVFVAWCIISPNK